MRPVLAVAILCICSAGISLDARSFRKQRQIIDPAISAVLTSHIPCDGMTSPEDHFIARVTFAPGNSERAFQVSAFQNDTCRVDLKVKCLNTDRAGWKKEWSIASSDDSKTGAFTVRSCYGWGSKEPAQYVLSGLYHESGANPKLPWKQAVVKQTSSNPDVYEFSGPEGGVNRIEIVRK